MKRIPVIIFGAGGVGQALLRQIVDGRSATAARNQIRFDAVAIADSKSLTWDPNGLTDEQLLGIIAAKQAGLPVDSEGKRPSNLDIIELAPAAELENVIVVDVTAQSGMEPIIDRALSYDYGFAMANKKALAGPWETAQKYLNHHQIRHESTVGGGQPVIATLRILLDTNDPIYEIEGQLSGTLGYICQQLDQGVAFSQTVAQAKARGYTEPDPREDLGGQDVMRKVLILGRMAGWPLAADDIAVESLYPAELAGLSVAQFMEATGELDEGMRRRVEAAAVEGNVLRYTAVLQKGRGTVGLKAIPANNPLANWKYISFRTERYNDAPLFIGGKGAGVEMTAAGVLGDMIDLVRES
ncbi:MAG: homoserine dehydrogenase [Chloroflexi bacterium]|nr:homoserine dehydrogenase [Chloroflexota bacterium]